MAHAVAPSWAATDWHAIVAAYDELLATVEESADQLTALVGNLLDSSRLAAGVVRPRLRAVYMDEVVHRSLVSVGVIQRGARPCAH
ncbi:hypothetical protein [Nocardia carnea]|uniref:hypothetical protein n=1 Tax=Nocardia carnea TaxID=37328 RepID=UPI002457347A|nr:hypothetical protein [Nocardia carnea]